MTPIGIDHLIYVTPDLEQGMTEVEALLGVRPVLGGRHPDFGTRNALLSLGPGCYLEVMAPDPGLPAPARGRLTDHWGVAAPRLVTWVLRTPTPSRSAADLGRVSGIDLGEISPCSRQTPEGEEIHWRLSDPYAERLGGTIPFLID